MTSNRESGDGFSDIMVRIDDEDVGIIIEVKYAENGKEEEKSRTAFYNFANSIPTRIMRGTCLQMCLKMSESRCGKNKNICVLIA